MKERPILFSGAMVRALLAGTKTQTRRIVKSQPPADKQRVAWYEPGVMGWAPPDVPSQHWHRVRCPYGQPGDRLWVREAHYLTDNGDEEYAVFAADSDAAREHLKSLDRLPPDFPTDVKDRHRKLRPSIHMPRWASRITLEVTGVRVERLQDISEGDALAEGIVRLRDGGYSLADSTHYHSTDPRQSYFSLWEAINGDGSVEANPWVWAVDFKRLEAAA